jgi:hypothetical protein
MYYILSAKDLRDTESIARIGTGPDIEDVDWYEGVRFTTPIPQPLRFTLDPSVEGSVPFFLDWTIPLMHGELIAGLKEAGVDNLDLYDAIVLDEETGEEFTDFKAVNVIGAIAAADLGASKYSTEEGTTLVSMQFDSLVIDEKKTGSVLLFRLAECVSAIVVHEKIRKVLKARDVLVGFIEPKDFAS